MRSQSHNRPGCIMHAPGPGGFSCSDGSRAAGLTAAGRRRLGMLLAFVGLALLVGNAFLHKLRSRQPPVIGHPGSAHLQRRHGPGDTAIEPTTIEMDASRLSPPPSVAGPAFVAARAEAPNTVRKSQQELLAFHRDQAAEHAGIVRSMEAELGIGVPSTAAAEPAPVGGPARSQPPPATYAKATPGEATPFAIDDLAVTYGES